MVSIGAQWDRKRERENYGRKRNVTRRSESYERERECNGKKNAIDEKKRML